MSSKVADLIRRVVPARFRPIGYLTHLAQQGSQFRVAGGPFAGMNYGPSSFGSAYIPKILGIYERELTPCIESSCAVRPDLIVDVGAAEGYYAVGLARRNPQARVIAFEAESRGREFLSDMVHRNDLAGRVEIRGLAEPHDLQAALAGAARPLVVCDVEGHEDSLLDPGAVTALLGATILVELHDFIKRGLGEEIEQRFAASHRVTRIWQEGRSGAEFPYPTMFTRLLPQRYLDWSVSEWRPERMSWLWMEPATSKLPGAAA